MATKKEWLWRLISFALGFVTGRITAPHPDYETVGEYVSEDPPPSEDEYIPASITLMAGFYQFMRCLAEKPEIFTSQINSLGPRAYRRWQLAVESWPELCAGLSTTTPADIDAALTTAARKAFLRFEESENRSNPLFRSALANLSPERLITIPPPEEGREAKLVYMLAKQAGSYYTQFVSELSGVLAGRIADEGTLKEIGLSTVDFARGFNEIAIAARPVLKLACSHVTQFWSETDSKKGRWWFPLTDVLSSGEWENKQLKCNDCEWTLDSNEYLRKYGREFVPTQDRCPACQCKIVKIQYWNPL